MSYKKFQELLLTEVRQKAGDMVEVSLLSMPKNNGVEKEALVLRSEGCRLSPSVYLEKFYEDFRKGVPVRHIAKLILDQYEQLKKKETLPDGFYSDYSKISARVFCKLINYGKNRQLLKEIPCELWQDLAVVYFYQVDRSVMEDAAILIRTEHLERWEISREQLREDAWKNSIAQYPPVCRKLSGVLKEMGDLESGAEEDPESPLYLLTNREKCLGAVCICYPGEARKIAEELNSGFYILPSSIHECLILPDKENYVREELDQMVREINQTQLEPQEVLSDHVYYYDQEKGQMFS